jgi:hypothetical protein
VIIFTYTLGNNDQTGSTAPWVPVFVSPSYQSFVPACRDQDAFDRFPTMSFGGQRENVSFKEQMRRLRQALSEIYFPPPRTPTKMLRKERNPTQGRHGFQMSYRLPGYRAKRAR